MDLIQAAESGDIIRVRELLNQGADPNIRDIDGDTALIKVTFNLIKDFSKDYTKIVELLLDHGADPNIPDRLGSTALMIASYRGVTEMVRLLLNRGADPNTREHYTNRTALMIASEYGHTEIIRLLLDRGADPNSIGIYGRTALMIAESEGNDDITRLIRDHISLQKARQRLAFATYLLGDNTRMDDLDYDVTSRIAEYVNDLDQYGSGSKRSSRRRRRSRRRRNYTRRRIFF